uniref:Uncharacterized protein n=1 Tax=Panagrolaimus sp. JU765 TaxID=591449 RepID=A0AC34Q7I4_9BILA
MQLSSKSNIEGIVEESYLLREDGFTVHEFAVNEKIGKVAVLRRLDKKGTQDVRGLSKIEFYTFVDMPRMFLDKEVYIQETLVESVATQDVRGLSKIEFYTFIDMPRMFLDKEVYIQETLVESVAWIGQSTLTCSCLDGSIIALSPFSTFKKRFQISATPFWCSTTYSKDEIAAGTDSGTILMMKQNIIEKDEIAAGTDSGTILMMKQNIIEKGNGQTSEELVVSRKFEVGTDQRPMAIAASKKMEKIAVGCLDKVFIIPVSATGGKVIPIQMPRENRRATIAWCLAFLKHNLFIGDSRGNVNIYDSRNGAAVKIVPSHESAILALSTDDKCVYAAGVDYRIQVFGAVENETDFKNIGQRMIHENDVKAMAVCNGW